MGPSPATTLAVRRSETWPSRLLYGLLVVEVGLILAAQSQQLAQSERAWLGLAAVAAVGAAMLLLLAWFLLALIFRGRFKFGVRSMLALIAAVAIACAWFTSEWNRARRQRALAAEAWRFHCGTLYDYNLSDSGLQMFSGTRPGSSPLQGLLGEDFFHEIVGAQVRADAALKVFEDQTSLRRIYGNDSQLTDAGMKSLEHLKGLTWLDLRDAPAVTDSGIEHLQQLTNLECLMLRRTGMTDAGMIWLKDLHQLEILDLAMTKVTHDGLQHLAEMTRLKQLLFWGNRIEDAGLVHLRGMTELEILNLGGAPVTDAGLESLQNLRQLKQLSLRGSRVTDDGLQHLAHLDQLQQLDLFNTNVSDAGLEHLKGLSRLTALHLGETKVTREGIHNLQQALPNCKIEH